MPRKRLARRFEPRAGISQPMLDAESVYVGQELRDYLVWSFDDLRQRLKERQAQLVTAEANLQFNISRLPDRERLAIRSMIARDFYHIAALYEQFLRSPQVTEATGPCKPLPEELTDDDEPASVGPFSEWLFDPEDSETE